MYAYLQISKFENDKQSQAVNANGTVRPRVISSALSPLLLLLLNAESARLGAGPGHELHAGQAVPLVLRRPGLAAVVGVGAEDGAAVALFAAVLGDGDGGAQATSAGAAARHEVLVPLARALLQKKFSVHIVYT